MAGYTNQGSAVNHLFNVSSCQNAPQTVRDQASEERLGQTPFDPGRPAHPPVAQPTRAPDYTRARGALQTLAESLSMSVGELAGDIHFGGFLSALAPQFHASLRATAGLGQTLGHADGMAIMPQPNLPNPSPNPNPNTNTDLISSAGRPTVIRPGCGSVQVRSFVLGASHSHLVNPNGQAHHLVSFTRQHSPATGWTEPGRAEYITELAEEMMDLPTPVFTIIAEDREALETARGTLSQLQGEADARVHPVQAHLCGVALLEMIGETTLTLQPVRDLLGELNTALGALARQKSGPAPLQADVRPLAATNVWRDVHAFAKALIGQKPGLMMTGRAHLKDGPCLGRPMPTTTLLGNNDKWGELQALEGFLTSLDRFIANASGDQPFYMSDLYDAFLHLSRVSGDDNELAQSVKHNARAKFASFGWVGGMAAAYLVDLHYGAPNDGAKRDIPEDDMVAARAAMEDVVRQYVAFRPGDEATMLLMKRIDEVEKGKLESANGGSIPMPPAPANRPSATRLELYDRFRDLAPALVRVAHVLLQCVPCMVRADAPERAMPENHALMAPMDGDFVNVPKLQHAMNGIPHPI